MLLFLVSILLTNTWQKTTKNFSIIYLVCLYSKMAELIYYS